MADGMETQIVWQHSLWLWSLLMDEEKEVIDLLFKMWYNHSGKSHGHKIDATGAVQENAI